MGSTAGVRQCAIEGAGLAFLSRVVVEDDLRAGRLREFDWAGTPLRRPLYVAHLEGAALSEPARALIELVRDVH